MSEDAMQDIGSMVSETGIIDNWWEQWEHLT